MKLFVCLAILLRVYVVTFIIVGGLQASDKGHRNVAGSQEKKSLIDLGYNGRSKTL